MDLPPDLDAEIRSALTELEMLSEQSGHPSLAFVLALRRALFGNKPEIKRVKAMIARPHPILEELLRESCWILPGLGEERVQSQLI